MRKLLLLVLATVLGLGTVPALVAPAQAATGVSIKTIANPAASPGSSVTVRPRYATSGPVKVVSATLTVTQGKRTVASAQKSVVLKVGAQQAAYGVKTVVRYQVKKDGRYGSTKSATKSQTLTVKPVYKKCATGADLDAVVLGSAPGKGDSVALVARKLGEPLPMAGGVLRGLEDDARAHEDGTRLAQIQALYEAGYTPSTAWSQFGYESCAGNGSWIGSVTFLRAKDGVERAWEKAFFVS